MTPVPKLPIGIMPEPFWREYRIRELAAAIARYQADIDAVPPQHRSQIGVWSYEMEQHTAWLQAHGPHNYTRLKEEGIVE